MGTHCDLPVCTPVKLEELKGVLESTFGRHAQVFFFFGVVFVCYFFVVLTNFHFFIKIGEM